MGKIFLDGERVVEKLKLAAARGTPILLQLAADEIRSAGGPYTSVYMYMVSSTPHRDELTLEAFSGRATEHVRIPFGRGVCGRAVSLGHDQNVGDVSAYPDYIACNAHTKSELVVLIRAHDNILGQIDIDSDLIDPFSPEEEASVKLVADALGMLLL